MKIRTGFVSNSSSSSFVCDVCGRQEVGFDACLSDFDMVGCVNGHIFCKDEQVKDLPEDWDEYDDAPEECCPICTFAVYAESDMMAYLKRKYGDDTTEAFAEVKAVNSRRKKLYDSEYVFYACKKHSTTVDVEFAEIKSRFGIYSKFSEYLSSKRK